MRIVVCTFNFNLSFPFLIQRSFKKPCACSKPLNILRACVLSSRFYAIFFLLIPLETLKGKHVDNLFDKGCLCLMQKIISG